MVNVESKQRIVHRNSEPSVSVIMPVRNEAAFIKKSIAAVLQQDYPAELMEILVSDGMSTDETRAILGDMIHAHPNIRIIDNPGRIAPTGLNAAIRQAKGEIIVRVDGHCIIQPDYVRKCVEYLCREKVAGVGGPMETIGETTVARAIAIAMSSPFGVGGSAFRTIKDRQIFVDTVAFPAYTRETIQKAGLFDEELIRNQDDEYNFRLREMGGRILMTPDIRSQYYSRSSFRSLWKQYFQYGYWKVWVLQKHPRQMSLRQFIPPLFVFSLLLLSTLALFYQPARIALALVVVLYIAANLLAAGVTAMQQGWKYLPFLSVAYAILHVSYGLGFLLGLVKFANRWKGVRTNE